jgi:hypothetical protein
MSTIGRLGVLLLMTAGLVNADNYPQPIQSFGVQGHFGRHSGGWDFNALLPFMKKMGVDYIKDEIYWSMVEQKQGEYKIDQANEDFVNAARANGIKLIFSLTYGNANYKNNLDPDAYANYCKFMASHFKGRVDVWEIWNEPQNFGFKGQYGGEWNGKSNSPWVEKFSILVEKAVQAIRSANPSATIITGGGNPPSTHHLITRFKDRLKGIDGLTEHPYPFRLPPETMPYGGSYILRRDDAVTADEDHSYSSMIRRLRHIGKQIDGKIPSIWITEVGYTTYNHYTNPNVLYNGYTQQVQAAYLVRMVAQSLGEKVSAVCIYDLKNDGANIFEAENNFGLIDNENRPKISAQAFMRLAEHLGGGHEVIDVPPAKLDCTIKEPIEDDTWKPLPKEPFVKVTGPQCYWFKTAKGLITIFWKAGRYNAEMNPPFFRFTWAGFAGEPPREAVDLVTGEKTALKTSMADKTLIVENLQMSSNPQIILWPAKK